MPKIIDDSEENLVKFLKESFEPDNKPELAEKKDQDMLAYAKLARFLSDTVKFDATSVDISAVLGEKYATRKEEDRIKGSFTRALIDVGKHYGFSPSIYILNGQVDHTVFAEVVTGKRLFRDVFTRPHDEFTHTVQWLVMAQHFYGELNVAELYRRSVLYKSKQAFKYTINNQESSGPAYMWNFLVDCFEGGGEDYRTNLMCQTYRCPQYVTRHLKGMKTESWLGEFLYVRSVKGTSKGEKAKDDGHYRARTNVVMGKDYLKRRNEEHGKPVYETRGNPKVLEKVYEEVEEETLSPPKKQNLMLPSSGVFHNNNNNNNNNSTGNGK